MKKISLISAVLLACLALSACGNQATSKTSSSSAVESSKVIKHHKQHKKATKAKSSSSSSSANSSSDSESQASSQNQTQQSNSGKSQSEINRERGYDPNGNPLLPGQDHAAGSNPDGSPDAWVQGQINWAIQNGYMNPDGTNTPKGQAAEDEVERDSQPGMP